MSSFVELLGVGLDMSSRRPLLLMLPCSQKQSPQEELSEAFKYFDASVKGKVGKKELKQVMSELGQTMNDQELDDILEVMDADKDGFITLNDFKTLMGIS